MNTYKEQFEPAQLEFDMSYEGLPRGDRGCILEHLAPLCKDRSHWESCHSVQSTNARIDIVCRAIMIADCMTDTD